MFCVYIIVFLVAIGVNVNLIKGKIGLHILAATTTEQMTGEHSISPSPASEYRVLCRESSLIFIFHKWKPFNKCKRMLLLVKNWKTECSFTS